MESAERTYTRLSFSSLTLVPFGPRDNAARNGALLASMVNDNNGYDYGNGGTHHHDSSLD